jgi:hypothetical protein
VNRFLPALLRWVLPPSDREHVLAEMEELYRVRLRAWRHSLPSGAYRHLGRYLGTRLQ